MYISSSILSCGGGELSGDRSSSGMRTKVRWCEWSVCAGATQDCSEAKEVPPALKPPSGFSSQKPKTPLGKSQAGKGTTPGRSSSWLYIDRSSDPNRFHVTAGRSRRQKENAPCSSWNRRNRPYSSSRRKRRRRGGRSW